VSFTAVGRLGVAVFRLVSGSVVGLFDPSHPLGPARLGVPLGLGPIDALIDVFGPFVIPVLLFAVGIVGYLLLVALGRAGIVGKRE
jgi:hypothetical protein